MPIMYRVAAALVLDTEEKAIQWRDAIKAKTLQAKDSGTFPAWVGASIGIQEYFVGGLATNDEALPWPPA